MGEILNKRATNMIIMGKYLIRMFKANRNNNWMS